MLHEVALGGVLFAPLVVFALVALAVTLLIRSLLWRTGVARLFWHLPLMEVSLFACILALLVHYG